MKQWLITLDTVIQLILLYFDGEKIKKNILVINFVLCLLIHPSISIRVFLSINNFFVTYINAYREKYINNNIWRVRSGVQQQRTSEKGGLPSAYWVDSESVMSRSRVLIGLERWYLSQKIDSTTTGVQAKLKVQRSTLHTKKYLRDR